MFPEPTELLLIDCFMEPIWTPRSKSNTLTPQINSQTYWQREISHVMNGIIFCVCSTSAISVPPIVLKWCRKERKKMQVKKESRWIWSRDAAQGIRTCLPSTASESLGKNLIWKSKYFRGPGMSSNQERRDMWWALAHQTTQNGTLTISGLLKSGDPVKCWKQERWDPWVDNQPVCSLSTQTSLHRLRWFGLFHRHRIRPFAQIKITLAQGEWSSAKDVRPIFKRCNTRQ